MPRRRPLYGSTWEGEGMAVNSGSTAPGVTGAAMDGAAIVAELLCWPVPLAAVFSVLISTMKQRRRVSRYRTVSRNFQTGRVMPLMSPAGRRALLFTALNIAFLKELRRDFVPADSRHLRTLT